MLADLHHQEWRYRPAPTVTSGECGFEQRPIWRGSIDMTCSERTLVWQRVLDDRNNRKYVAHGGTFKRGITYHLWPNPRGVHVEIDLTIEGWFDERLFRECVENGRVNPVQQRCQAHYEKWSSSISASADSSSVKSREGLVA